MVLENVAENTIGKVLAVVVVLAILGGTIALVFTNLTDVLAAFTAMTPTGEPTVDAIIPVFAILIGLGVVFGLVTLILNSTK